MTSRNSEQDDADVDFQIALHNIQHAFSVAYTANQEKKYHLRDRAIQGGLQRALELTSGEEWSYKRIHKIVGWSPFGQ